MALTPPYINQAEAIALDANAIEALMPVVDSKIQTAVSSATTNGNLGDATPATNPTPPPTTNGVFYFAQAGETYPNFKDSTNTAITIPSLVDGKYPVDIKLIWNLAGGYWVPTIGNYIPQSSVGENTPYGQLILTDTNSWTNYAVMLDGVQYPSAFVKVPLASLSNEVKTLLVSDNGYSHIFLNTADANNWTTFAQLQDGGLYPTTPQQSTSTTTPTNVTPAAWFNKNPNIYKYIPKFSTKFSGGDGTFQMVTILVFGDSLFASNTNYAPVGNVVQSEYPPTLCNEKATTMLWRSINHLEKPTYYRYDRTPNIYTETGSFTTASTNANWDDANVRFGQTRFSVNAGAGIQFTVGSDKGAFNFIDRTDRDGGDVVINVAEGSGKLLVKFPGTTSWVEANGATFTQNDTNSGALYGDTIYQRRIEFKKVVLTDSTTVAINKIVNGTNDPKRFLYWGIETMTGTKPYFIILDMARRGNDLSQLQEYVLNDLVDRKPDIVVMEVPLFNMIQVNNTRAYNVNWVWDFIWGDRTPTVDNPLLVPTNRTLKYYSDNWTKFELVTILPHIPVRFVDANGNYLKIDDGLLTCPEMWNAVGSLFHAHGDVYLINLFAHYKAIAEAEYAGNYYEMNKASGVEGLTYSADGNHQNKKGNTQGWARCLNPIFDMTNL